MLFIQVSLSIEFSYPVLSRAHPLRRQEVMRMHRANFESRKTPLPDWLVKSWAGGGVVGRHIVLEQMRQRLATNKTRAGYRARQRMAWALVLSRCCQGDGWLGGVPAALRRRLAISVSSRTR